MDRIIDLEILERPGVPDELISRAYNQLTWIHRLLGDTAAVVAALENDPLPVRRILDIGCAEGGVLQQIRKKLAVDVIGVDIRRPAGLDLPFPIWVADAVHEPLPEADVAFSMYVGHHLSDEEITKLIRNVGRFCRRFILLDLIRHPLPLCLFRVFVAPLVCPIVTADGATSIRRSYTGLELKQLVAKALDGSAGTYRYSVGPLYMRQIIDIDYKHRSSPVVSSPTVGIDWRSKSEADRRGIGDASLRR